MPKISRQVGTTSQLVDILALNSSSSTGAGLTGLAYNTSGLTCYYHRNTANASVAVTLATMTLGTWATGGFVVVDGTDMPGLYQLGIPNAALASGADSVVFYLQGAANMAPIVLEIELTAVNNQSTAFGLLIAKTTNITGFNDIAATAIVSSGAITTSSGAVSTVTTVTNQLTAAAIATGVWQDATSSDFTTTSSIGKSLYTSGNAPGAASGLAVVGSNMGTVSSVTGAVGSVTGNVGGSVGSISGVTFPTHFSLLSIDTNGYVTFNNTTIATATSVTSAVTLNLTQTLSAGRALDSIADTSLTLNDALQCAVASVTAQVDASSGTSCTFKTASTGTLLRTKTLTTISTPSTVVDKAV